MIFPQPQKEELFNGAYLIKDYEDNFNLLYLYKKYKNGTEDIKIINNQSFGSEEYEISIDDEGITVTVSSDEGIFRAISSLKQLLKSYGAKLPHLLIHDKPDFGKRAYMLDISRCRMPKVKTITKLIDLLADLKYNEFQLYMESFVYKYDAFPKYIQKFNCLGPDEIKYLNKYCRERFIDLVPNQNSLGHLGKWLDTDDFKHLRVGDDNTNTSTINPLLDESFEFIDNLYESLLPHFDSEYVNIGLDEAFGLGKYQLKEICEEKGKDTVFMDWLCKLAEHIKTKYGKKVQFWSDMIYNYPEAYKRIPEGAVALNWGYDIIETILIEKRCMDLQAKGADYYICPGNSNWISFTGRFDVMSSNLRTSAEMGKKYGAIGYLLTDWGCGEGHYHFPVWSFVPAALGAQYAWNVGEEQNGENHKTHYIRAANKYIDENIFNAKVSEHLQRLQQYYLLEPERVHCMTMCGYTIRFPINETKGAHFFDLRECGDDFYFDNIIYYVGKILTELNDIDFDEIQKRQIVINSKMVILSAEICKIRINGTALPEKIEELTGMIDEICEEYAVLWDMENYPDGKEFFINQLLSRKKELIELGK